MRAFGSTREEATLDQLEKALKHPRQPAAQAINRIRAFAAKDAADLEPELRRRVKERQARAEKDLFARGEAEANSLKHLLEAQRDRVAKATSRAG